MAQSIVLFAPQNHLGSMTMGHYTAAVNMTRSGAAALRYGSEATAAVDLKSPSSGAAKNDPGAEPLTDHWVLFDDAKVGGGFNFGVIPHLPCHADLAHLSAKRRRNSRRVCALLPEKKARELSAAFRRFRFVCFVVAELGLLAPMCEKLL